MAGPNCSGASRIVKTKIGVSVSWTSNLGKNLPVMGIRASDLFKKSCKVVSSSGAFRAKALLKRSMCRSKDLTLPSSTKNESATNTLL